MANVSSSNGLEKRPKLRFPGFEEPWKDTFFSDLYEAVSEKNDGSFGVENIISVANMYFKEDARITDEEYLKTYNIFKVGDIAFEGNKSNDFSHGRFVENTIGDGIVSHVFVVFRPLHDTHNLRYWKYAINNESVMGRILARCTKKTTMMTNLVTKDFLNQTILCPSAQEQDKIANLLDGISERIKLQKLYVESLKKYKRGLSDTLFAQIAHNPDCVIVKFGEAFELLQNNTFSREELTDIPSSVQNIHYGDVLIKYGSVVNIATDMPPYIKPSNDLQRFSRSSYLCDGDIVFADTAEDYSVGKATEIVGVNGASVLSGLHTIPCRPFMKFQPMYLGFYFNSSLFRAQIYPLVQGTKVSSISKGELAKVSVHIPNEGDQRRIASMLYSLDLRVAHEERQVKALTDVKAAFLQQLFI